MGESFFQEGLPHPSPYKSQYFILSLQDADHVV